MDIVTLMELTTAGRQQSKVEAQKLEFLVAQNTEDVDSRIKLIAFYFGQGSTNRAPREHACEHIFWFIKHMPAHIILSQPEAHPHFHTEFDVLYIQGEQLWDEQLSKDPNDVAILVNAAHFYYHHNWGKAISLLEAALAVAPNNEQIKDRLAFTYELSARSDKSDERLKRAMQLREELAKVSDRTLRKLIKLAETAYKLDSFEDCRALAKEVLSRSAPYDENGDEFHIANQLLGLIALEDDDLHTADLALLRSCEIKATPVLGSFGPKFQLAKKLLAQGEKSTVLKYLRKCSLFWKSGQTCLAYWWLQIQFGRKPELNKQGIIELFTPKWLRGPASCFMTLVRTLSDD
jgi:tetratricopeptide (TPR) repeat protein